MTFAMTRNLGGLDRLLRFYVGLLLIALALPYWAPDTGWNWMGWLGLPLVLGALTGSCGVYRLAGISTCPR